MAAAPKGCGAVVKKGRTPAVDKGRFYLLAAGVVFALFVADVLIAKVQVLSGNTMPVHLGDTLQFIVLLVAVTLFVIGTLARERLDRDRDADSIEPQDP